MKYPNLDNVRYIFCKLPEVVAGGIYDVLIKTDISTDFNKAQENLMKYLDMPEYVKP